LKNPYFGNPILFKAVICLSPFVWDFFSFQDLFSGSLFGVLSFLEAGTHAAINGQGFTRHIAVGWVQQK
jgi:hypothetical protein